MRRRPRSVLWLVVPACAAVLLHVGSLTSTAGATAAPTPPVPATAQDAPKAAGTDGDDVVRALIGHAAQDPVASVRLVVRALWVATLTLLAGLVVRPPGRTSTSVHPVTADAWVPNAPPPDEVRWRAPPALLFRH